MTNNIDSLKVKLIEYITTMTSEEGLKDIEQFIEVNTFYPKPDNTVVPSTIMPEQKSVFNSVLDVLEDLERIELVRSE